MSRYFPDLPDSDGFTFRQALNHVLQAIRSMFSGPGRASNPVIGQINHDTSTNLLEFFGADGATWQTLLDFVNAVKMTPWSFTTTGTGTAGVLTPTVPLSAYGLGAVYLVKFHLATLTTLNVSGLGARNLKQYDSSGAKVAATIKAGLVSFVIDDGTDWLVMNPLTPVLPSIVNSFNTRAGAVTLTQADITAVGAAILANIIQSFNGRIGAVTLTAADVTGVGGAMNANVVNSFNGRQGAVSLALADITALTGTYLNSFNGRTGAVALTLADLNAAFTDNLQSATAGNGLILKDATNGYSYRIYMDTGNLKVVQV